MYECVNITCVCSCCEVLCLHVHFALHMYCVLVTAELRVYFLSFQDSPFPCASCLSVCVFVCVHVRLCVLFLALLELWIRSFDSPVVVITELILGSLGHRILSVCLFCCSSPATLRTPAVLPTLSSSSSHQLPSASARCNPHLHPPSLPESSQ